MRWTLAIVLSLVISAQAARADEWGAEIVSQPLSGEIARLAVEACDDVTYQDIVDECASWLDTRFRLSRIGITRRTRWSI
jgi:hypothetical protein